MTGLQTLRGLRWNAIPALLISLFLLPALVAQESPDDSYILPRESIKNVLDRSRHFDRLNAMGPDRDHFLIPVVDEFTTLELMSQRTLRLGMLEICPDVNREWRVSTFGVRQMKIYSRSGAQTRDIALPDNALFSDAVWSPDGKQIAFLAHLSEGSQVWTADVDSGSASAVSEAWVMATLAGVPRRSFGRSGPQAPSRLLQWTADGSLVTLLVPSDRGPEPDKSSIPDGPTIRTTRKKKTPTRTYPFLLRTQHDRDLFRYYTTSQIAILKRGQAPREIGEPGMFEQISVSPDSKHILSERIVGDLSYITSYQSFGRTLEVLDMSGNVLSTIRENPLQEAIIPRGGRNPRDDRPREVAWRPDGDGLYYLLKEKREKSEDGEEEQGDSNGKRKDRLMHLSAPFDTASAEVLVEDENGLRAARFSKDGKYAFLTSTTRGEGPSRQSIVAYDLNQSPAGKHVLVDGIDAEDVVKLPGNLMLRQDGNGVVHAIVAGGSAVFLKGDGFQENFHPRPFVDRIEIASGEKSRIFEGASDRYENPIAAPDDEMNSLIVSRESKTEFPNSYLWTKNGAFSKLTDNVNPFPEFHDVERVDFEFERRDGLKIQGRISLPIGYQPGTRVPAVFWTYPREFNNPKAYKRAAVRSRNQSRFHQMNYRNASDIWLAQGYAVVEPDIPIIGKPYNEHYVAHLIDSMYAAIRKVDELGYVDVDRLGHGGHSYGAFATANVLSHTPYFKAGIAGDGAYNRTLTPMSFQRESRFIWDAEGVYLEMSPFFQADRMETPLLMYHGAEDNNSGTFLIQSERYIQALTGLGKTAVLYIYPFESHGPRAKETYYDLWARWVGWFDKYVKTDSEPMPEMSGEGQRD